MAQINNQKTNRRRGQYSRYRGFMVNGTYVLGYKDDKLNTGVGTVGGFPVIILNGELTKISKEQLDTIVKVGKNVLSKLEKDS